MKREQKRKRTIGLWKASQPVPTRKGPVVKLEPSSHDPKRLECWMDLFSGKPEATPRNLAHFSRNKEQYSNFVWYECFYFLLSSTACVAAPHRQLHQTRELEQRLHRPTGRGCHCGASYKYMEPWKDPIGGGSREGLSYSLGCEAPRHAALRCGEERLHLLRRR